MPGKPSTNVSYYSNRNAKFRSSEMETSFALCLEPEQRAESWWVQKEFTVMVKSQTDWNSNPDITY